MWSFAEKMFEDWKETPRSDDEAKLGTRDSKGSTYGPWTRAFDPEVYVETAGWVSLSLLIVFFFLMDNGTFSVITFNKGLTLMSAH